MDDQGFVGQGADIGLVAGQIVDSVLPWRREHRGERLLEARADAGLVAQLGQLVVDQGAVVGEQIEQPAHVGQRRRVAPRHFQPLGDRKGHADAAHQHQPAHALGVTDGQCQRQPAAERVADDVGLLDAEGVEHADGMLDPARLAVLSIGRTFAVAEAEHVRSDHPARLRQLRNDPAPVGPGGDARPGAVDQQNREAFALIMQVGAVASGEDFATDFRALLRCVHGQLLRVSHRCFSARCRIPASAHPLRARCPTACCRRRRCAGRAGTSC